MPVVSIQQAVTMSGRQWSRTVINIHVYENGAKDDLRLVRQKRQLSTDDK